ncbi:MAG: pyruvoyl-dependent arginine decarboxylase [Candidatus Paceibacterota bacterium]
MEKKEIIITDGTGKGSTALSAFDSALFAAGIANYNLIRLSSVIPEGFTPKVEKVDWNSREYGRRLYLVLAQETARKPGDEAWAGLGWVETTVEPTKGLFVEHHGKNESEVADLINRSLTDMVKYRPEEFGPIKSHIVGTKYEDRPSCALVAALYQVDKWD